MRPEEGEQRRGELVGVQDVRPEHPGELGEPAVGRRGPLHAVELDVHVAHAAVAQDLDQGTVGSGHEHVVAPVGGPAREVHGVHLAATEIELVDGDEDA